MSNILLNLCDRLDVNIEFGTKGVYLFFTLIIFSLNFIALSGFLELMPSIPLLRSVLLHLSTFSSLIYPTECFYRSLSSELWQYVNDISWSSSQTSSFMTWLIWYEVLEDEIWVSSTLMHRNFNKRRSMKQYSRSWH
jgi:hypothetical protein